MTNAESSTIEEQEESGAQLQSTAVHSHPSNTRWQLFMVGVVVAALGALAVGVVTGLSLSDPADEKASVPPNREQPTYTFPDTPINYNATKANRTPVPDSLDACSDLRSDLRAAALAVGNSEIDFVSLLYYKLGYVDLFNESAVYDDDTLYASRDVDSARRTRRLQQRANTGETKQSTKFSPNSWRNTMRYVGVESADLVQSNGTDIFIVYGDEVVVLNVATMTIVTRTVFPRTQYDANGGTVLGILLVDDRLVVFNRQYDYEKTNTTVFVYDAPTMTLLTSETLPGEYKTAHAIGTNIHVTTFFGFYDFQQTLGPEYIQSLVITPLDEQSYRNKAQDELSRQLDPLVDVLMAHLDLDCTGYMRTPSFMLSNGYFKGYNTLATISSFDVLSSRTWNTTHMLLPGENLHWNLVASKDHALLVCNVLLFNITNANVPAFDSTNPRIDPLDNIIPEYQSYLVALQYENASIVVAFSGTVPGIVDVDVGIDLFKKDGQDYIQAMSTSYGELYGPPRFINPPLTMTVLKIAKDANNWMPQVSQQTGLGKVGDMVHAALFRDNFTIVSSANDTDTVYLLNMTNPTNPHTIAELAIPGYTSLLVDISGDLILSIGAHGTTMRSYHDTSSRLLLLNVSEVSRPRLLFQWGDEPPITGNVTESFSFGLYHRYLVDRQILILPLSVSRAERAPCSDRESDRFTSSSDDEYEYCDEATSTFTRRTTTFDGFQVFQINASTGISEYFSIEQPSGESFTTDGCTLPSRALVFGDTLVTLRGQLVLSHNLSTMAEFAPAVNLKKGSNCSSDFPGE